MKYAISLFNPEKETMFISEYENYILAGRYKCVGLMEEYSNEYYDACEVGTAVISLIEANNIGTEDSVIVFLNGTIRPDEVIMITELEEKIIKFGYKMEVMYPHGIINHFGLLTSGYRCVKNEVCL